MLVWFPVDPDFRETCFSSVGAENRPYPLLLVLPRGFPRVGGWVGGPVHDVERDGDRGALRERAQQFQQVGKIFLLLPPRAAPYGFFRQVYDRPELVPLGGSGCGHWFPFSIVVSAYPISLRILHRNATPN